MQPWCGFDPRSWQPEAFDAAVKAINAGQKALVHAVMGSGKSLLIAELAAQAAESAQLVVVSTPTVALVEQLAATLDLRGLSPTRYYTHSKGHEGQVIVSCNPSLLSLSADLAGRQVGLWIVDEAHNSECQSLLAAETALTPTSVVGLTATPYRADDKQGLSIFDVLAYSYGVADAIRDGVVVPMELRPWSGEEVGIDEACAQMVESAVAEQLGPGIVDADTIADAVGFAQHLRDRGIAAEAVHSKRSKKDNDATIHALKSGACQVIVHCAMLKEGVDLPWLRWLCLRRAVSSRVWFAQHVGRVLRAAEGKEKAVVFDPHDLFGSLDLTYEAVVGGAPTLSEGDEIKSEAAGLLDDLHGLFGWKPRRIPAENLRPVERFLRRLLVSLKIAGAIPSQNKVEDGSWRYKATSPKQVQALEDNAHKIKDATWAAAAPPEVVEHLRWVYASRHELRRGAASDMLDIVFRLRRWPKALAPGGIT